MLCVLCCVLCVENAVGLFDRRLGCVRRSRDQCTASCCCRVVLVYHCCARRPQNHQNCVYGTRKACSSAHSGGFHFRRFTLLRFALLCSALLCYFSVLLCFLLSFFALLFALLCFAVPRSLLHVLTLRLVSFLWRGADLSDGKPLNALWTMTNTTATNASRETLALWRRGTAIR